MTKYEKLVADAAKATEFYSEDELQEDEIIICPECGSDDVSPLHYQGDYAVPETDYKHCNECGHSWGYE
jgi:DNA-directed RNA polymerase subunit M/transcription elongation factor TFIIS